jgi:hypothetical protein
MNMNQRFLEEAKQLEARWNKHGLLDGIKDRWSRQTTAVLLESQRLMNEECTKNLSVATSTFCPRCGTVLEVNEPYFTEAGDPVRMQCPGCKYYYQAGW